MKSCLYFSLLSSVMFTGAAFAACTPSPDCASLGYTATSCPDGGVKCPWDTSLWHCNECGPDYKYDCTRKNEASGAGTTCNNKFASCNCTDGYAWKDGSCKSITASSGRCCDEKSAGCDSNALSYWYCKEKYGWIDCADMQSSCKESGGTPRVQGCFQENGSMGYYGALLYCDF